MSSAPSPPFLLTLLLRLAAGRHDRAVLLGDLEEEFRELARTRGRAAAIRWYQSQAARSVAPLLLVRAGHVVATRSVGAAAIGALAAIASGLVMGRALHLLLGPCEGFTVTAVGLAVGCMALVSSTCAGWLSQWLARDRNVVAVLTIGVVVVAPEALYTLRIAPAVVGELMPLAVAIAATVGGLAIGSGLSRLALLDPTAHGGSA